MNPQPKIYVAGHQGIVGAAIVRQLQAMDCHASLAMTSEPTIITRTHAEFELTNQAAVRAFFEAEKPDQVYMAAARVGGIHANNTCPAEFIYDNLMVEANVIHQAWCAGVLEPTNEPYVIAANAFNTFAARTQVQQSPQISPNATLQDPKPQLTNPN